MLCKRLVELNQSIQVAFEASLMETSEAYQQRFSDPQEDGRPRR
jgi:hypothetical protein